MCIVVDIDKGEKIKYHDVLISCFMYTEENWFSWNIEKSTYWSIWKKSLVKGLH